MAGGIRTMVRLGILCALATVGQSGGDGARAQTLTVASSAPVTSIDPHYHTLSPNISLHGHIYDRLIHRNAKGEMEPGLAVSWKLIDDTTWELKLRSATFHNGAPFTAIEKINLDIQPKLSKNISDTLHLTLSINHQR